MSYEEVISTIREATELLSSGRAALLDVEADRVLFVGDTHGFPDVSETVIDYAYKEDIDLVVFMGDYVDRGPNGVENLNTILTKMLEAPEKFIVLRGNHESPLTNYSYGFYDEVASKLGEDAYKYYEALFVSMPYFAVVNGWFIVHGGIPCKLCKGEAEEPFTLKELSERVSSIHGRQEGLIPDDEVALQLLWNDPRPEIEWFTPSIRGEGIYFYGREAWRRFLVENELKGIIRAHEAVDAFRVIGMDGSIMYTSLYEMKAAELRGSVITVFSSRYHGAGTGILLMDNVSGVFKFIRI